MAINLVEKIQQNIGIDELQKIDPNTQEIKRPETKIIHAVTNNFFIFLD